MFRTVVVWTFTDTCESSNYIYNCYKNVLVRANSVGTLEVENTAIIRVTVVLQDVSRSSSSSTQKSGKAYAKFSFIASTLHFALRFFKSLLNFLVSKS